MTKYIFDDIILTIPPDIRNNKPIAAKPGSGSVKEAQMTHNIEKYTVRPLKNNDRFTVTVPGSKSITNRALLLAAMCEGPCTLNGVLFSDDSRAFLSCLKNLGFELTIDEEERRVTIEGTGGRIPNRKAGINVGSAGTAARFLTVFLAFAGGEYEMNASPQMCKRPMEPLISDLKKAGVEITCRGEEGHFPFTLKSSGITLTEMVSNTDISSQFASAILMASPLLENGIRLILEGSRTNGSYINITLRMMSEFGFSFTRKDNIITVSSCRNTNCPEEAVITKRPGISCYDIEPDISAACYFYAMSPICGKIMQVKDVHPDSMQGDYQFIKFLEQLGCVAADDKDGVILSPPPKREYPGLDIDLKDFSDQTMTMAVTAAFATSPTTIRNVGHIRYQESDRLHAIINELNRLGCKCSAIDEDTGIHIEPGAQYGSAQHGTSYHGADIETYEDHRMAMAFALAGLRIPGVNILNPGCCRKTFGNYFEVLDSICVNIKNSI